MTEQRPQQTEQRPQQEGLPLVLLAGNGQADTGWLRSLLEGSGYAVLQERSARHALDRARTTEPDVIVVDAELPDMTGVELCGSLRGDSRVSSSTPILLAIRDPATRTQRLEALRAGAWECITPPHDADEILLKIGAYVHAKLDADRARAEGLLDSNTGLYNRQGLVRRARELVAQAFRDHGPLACVVLALDVDPSGSTVGAPGSVSLASHVQAMRSAARLSDVIGRLSTHEFAVLAPGTDAGGARRLAERLAGSVSAVRGTAPAETAAPIRVRCGYEAVANIGYMPIEPVDLLVRAAAAVRTGRADANGWLRRFDEGVGSSAPT
ncbi:MAG TPA: response regulator [Gemmatimonadales bacterium]|nr:response regulator [Gemmatimonadales bacterium]